MPVSYKLNREGDSVKSRSMTRSFKSKIFILILFLNLPLITSSQTLSTSNRDESIKTEQGNPLPTPITAAATEAEAEKSDDNKVDSERFNPSEEVSKDLSVSFPVDI